MKKIFLTILLTITTTAFAQQDCKERLENDFELKNKDHVTMPYRSLMDARMGDSYIGCHDEIDAILKRFIGTNGLHGIMFDELTDAVLGTSSTTNYGSYIVGVLKPMFITSSFTEDEVLPTDLTENMVVNDTFLHILIREQGADNSYDVVNLVRTFTFHTDLECAKNAEGDAPLDIMKKHGDRLKFVVAGKKAYYDDAKEIMDLLSCK